MISREIQIDDDNAKELMELTGKIYLKEAVTAAIQFTLLHDKDSVQEALKS